MNTKTTNQTKLTNGDTIETYTDDTGTYSAMWQIGNKTGDCYQKGDEVTSETADDECRISTKNDYDRFQREPRSAAQEALLVAFEVNCADLVSRFGYEINAGTALATLRADRIEERERLNW